MPLSEKARIEIYLPDLPAQAYRNLLEALDLEFTYTFGRCTVSHGLAGSYLSKLGTHMEDRVNLIYTDTPLSINGDRERLSLYVDTLRRAVFVALDEEAVLVLCQALILG